NLSDLRELLEKGASDVGRHPLEEHPRAAGHLVAHARGDLGYIEGGHELVLGDCVGDVDRKSHVDQVVVRLLLIGGGGALPAPTAQAPNEDATGQPAHGEARRDANPPVWWHTSGTVSVDWMTC